MAHHEASAPPLQLDAIRAGSMRHWVSETKLDVRDSIHLTCSLGEGRNIWVQVLYVEAVRGLWVASIEEKMATGRFRALSGLPEGSDG